MREAVTYVGADDLRQRDIPMIVPAVARWIAQGIGRPFRGGGFDDEQLFPSLWSLHPPTASGPSVFDLTELWTPSLVIPSG